MAGITTVEYQTLLLSIPETLKTSVIAPNSSGSAIETRYVTSEGRDDEAWLGALRDQNGVCDIWLMTFNLLVGLDQESDQRGAVNTITKPIGIVLDYYADYAHGKDAVGDVGEETVTNTEREFLKKIFAVDLAIEMLRGCLSPNIYIRSWDFRLKLRRFDTATVHWASGLLQLEVTDILMS